jgi:two-component system, response regulator PdtaR
MPNDTPAILVVEDETFVRIDALDALSEIGVPCYEAAEAEEALHELEEHPAIAVLVTDLDMPGEMDGVALAERVHATRPDVEIVVTSGAQRLQDDDLPDHGTFLAKPYQPARLVSLIREKLHFVGTSTHRREA